MLHIHNYELPEMLCLIKPSAELVSKFILMSIYVNLPTTSAILDNNSSGTEQSQLVTKLGRDIIHYMQTLTFNSKFKRTIIWFFDSYGSFHTYSGNDG
jgi:hypothetical protein